MFIPRLKGLLEIFGRQQIGIFYLGWFASLIYIWNSCHRSLLILYPFHKINVLLGTSDTLVFD